MVRELFSDPKLLGDDDAPKHLEKRHKNRPLQVQTLFGEIGIVRNYYHHVPSGTGRCPLDESIGLVDALSPAMARLMCRAAAKSSSYSEASADLHAYAGVEIQVRAFDRLVNRVAPTLTEAAATLAPAAESASIPVFYASIDGTGVPMRGSELKGRTGRQPDGSAKTRESKLGCVFTQSVTDEEGQPLRDPGSSSYIGTFAGCDAAGALLRQEALRRGLSRSSQVVFLGDGAAWVWNCARNYFPGSVEILDFFHASEYVRQLADALFGPQSADASHYRKVWTDQMKETNPDAMVEQARGLLKETLTLSPQCVEDAQGAIDYLENQAKRTRYGDYRAKGYFIGSGVIEAGCKSVVGRRLKQSGMFWSESGAENLLALRCLVLGPHFDAAWSARREILKQQQLVSRRWTPSLN